VPYFIIDHENLTFDLKVANMEQNYEFTPVRYDYDYFELFLNFLTTIEPGIFTKKIIQYNNPKIEDIEISYIYEWKNSLEDDYSAVQILYQEILYQIPKCRNEIEIEEKLGFSNKIQQIIFLVRYETFINAIYILCENLACLLRDLYPGASLSTHFYNQKNNQKEIIKNVDEYYSKILDRADWYDEVQLIRSKFTHNLSIYVRSSNSGETVYLVDKIEEEHVKELYERLCSFLTEISKHFIKKCNMNKQIGGLCFKRSNVGQGFRAISLNDILLRNPPTCIAMVFNCPHEEKCNALNKPSERGN